MPKEVACQDSCGKNQLGISQQPSNTHCLFHTGRLLRIRGNSDVLLALYSTRHQATCRALRTLNYPFKRRHLENTPKALGSYRRYTMYRLYIAAFDQCRGGCCMISEDAVALKEFHCLDGSINGA